MDNHYKTASEKMAQMKEQIKGCLVRCICVHGFNAIFVDESAAFISYKSVLHVIDINQDVSGYVPFNWFHVKASFNGNIVDFHVYWSAFFAIFEKV